jgi:hypothetical protein
MLIPIIDNLRYLNLHVFWLKVEWIDPTFMPCEYFGTSIELFGGYYYFLMILSSVLCPIRFDSTKRIMMPDVRLRARVDVFFSPRPQREKSLGSWGIRGLFHVNVHIPHQTAT